MPPLAPVNNPGFGPSEQVPRRSPLRDRAVFALAFCCMHACFGDRECGLNTRNARQACGHVGHTTDACRSQHVRRRAYAVVCSPSL